MKNKTLGELMDMPVTDELKREVDKRVWKAQGGTPKTWCHGDIHLIDDRHTINCCQKCGYRGPWGKDSMGYMTFDHYEIPPDITRPENFWPLLWKMMLNNGVSLCAFNNILELEIGGTERDEWLRHTNPGLAVAFAYLKIEEAK